MQKYLFLFPLLLGVGVDKALAEEGVNDTGGTEGVNDTGGTEGVNDTGGTCCFFFLYVDTTKDAPQVQPTSCIEKKSLSKTVYTIFIHENSTILKEITFKKHKITKTMKSLSQKKVQIIPYHIRFSFSKWFSKPQSLLALTPPPDAAKSFQRHHSHPRGVGKILASLGDQMLRGIVPRQQ